MFNLSGKIALVTGATGGIGGAIARSLHAQGATVVLSGTREAVLQDYVRFARAKGLSPTRIVLVHVLKNIMIPVVTILGLELGSMIAFAVVTETVFAYPGMGKLLYDAVMGNDTNLALVALLLVALVTMLATLGADLAQRALDPRLRER